MDAGWATPVNYLLLQELTSTHWTMHKHARLLLIFAAVISALAQVGCNNAGIPTASGSTGNTGHWYWHTNCHRDAQCLYYEHAETGTTTDLDSIKSQSTSLIEFANRPLGSAATSYRDNTLNSTGGGNNGTIVTSPDGISWTSQAAGVASSLNGVAWNGSQFSAAGDVSTLISSSDGLSWTVRVSP